MMTSSPTRSRPGVCVPFLCLVTLLALMAEDCTLSAAETEDEPAAKAAALLPADGAAVHALPPKSLRGIHTDEGRQSPRKRHTRDTRPQPPDVHFEPPVATIVFLFFLLLLVIVALVYFYRQLNRESEGQYAPRRLLQEARERVHSARRAVEARVGGVLRTPAGQDEEMGEDEDEDENEEESREKECKQDAESLPEDEQGEQGEQGEEDSSDDYSSMEDFQPQGALLREKKGKRASQEKRAEVMEEKKKEKEGEEEGEEGCRGGRAGEGVLADLKEISGSAIWAEEEKKKGDLVSCDLTEL